MRRIVCEDCKKRYDYDRDEFCPRCGAFNRPTKAWGTDSQGNIIRVDGVNERTHAGSFVHKEVHREKNVRRAAGLDKSAQRPTPSRQTPQRPIGKPPLRSRIDDSAFLHILLWIAGAVFFASVILPWIFTLLWSLL